MAPVTPFEQTVINSLAETRSVGKTADRLELPERHVQRVALMAFGLGRLEVNLIDF